MSSTVSGAETLLSSCITALAWAGLECRSMNTTHLFPKSQTNQKFHLLFFPSTLNQSNFWVIWLKVQFQIETLEQNWHIHFWHWKVSFTKSLSFTALIHSKGPMASPNLWNTNFCSILNWNRKSVFIRKWLHLYHSTSSLCFYSSVCLCPLPIKSLWSALKALKISGHLVLRSSEDSLVSHCVPKVQTGHSKVEHAALSCENNIKINQVCSPWSSHNNRHGLGYTITPKVPRNKLSKH